MRLDLYLHTLYPQYSKRQWGKFLDQGQLILDGIHDRKPLPLSKGTDTGQFPQGWVPQIDWDQISKLIDWNRPEAKKPAKIIYEDQFLVVTHKPPGIPCHPNHPGDPETLLDQLRKVRVQPASREGFLLHRLDKDTSGLVFFAKSQESYGNLLPLFRRSSNNHPKMVKIYHARVWGNPPWSEYLCTSPLAHSKTSKQKVVAVSPNLTKYKNHFRGSPVATETMFRVLSQDSSTSLLEATIQTGMMHQIRVHCASLGYPIVGDQVYSDSATVQNHWNRFGHHLLDCWSVSVEPWELYPKGLEVVGPRAQWAL
jgi:RluA family pseudouridine synthase